MAISISTARLRQHWADNPHVRLKCVEIWLVSGRTLELIVTEQSQKALHTLIKPDVGVKFGASLGGKFVTIHLRGDMVCCIMDDEQNDWVLFEEQAYKISGGLCEPT